MKHIKLFEEFVFELADSSKIYEYELKLKMVEGAKLWQAFFTTSSGLKYVCNMIDSEEEDKITMRKYSDKVTGGALKPAKLKNIQLSEMNYYELNYKVLNKKSKYTDLTGKGEMPSIVSTIFDVAKKVCERDEDPRFFGFFFEGTPKDDETKDATQRTRIYRYFVSKIFPEDFKMYEDGNITRVIRVK